MTRLQGPDGQFHEVELEPTSLRYREVLHQADVLESVLRLWMLNDPRSRECALIRNDLRARMAKVVSVMGVDDDE